MVVVSFGKKSATVAMPIAPATRSSTGKSSAGAAPWAAVALFAGAGLIVVLAFVLVVIPSISDSGQQADPLGGSWRAPLAEMCPTPTVSADGLASVRKNANTSLAAYRPYAKRTDELTKLGRHIACAAVHNPARLCSPAARTEFLGHVKKYFSLRTEMLDRLAAAAGKSTSEFEKSFPEYLTSNEVVLLHSRLNEREREQVTQMTPLVEGDPNVLGGLGDLVEGGYLDAPELARLIGSKPGVLASVWKAQATRRVCR